MPLTWTGKQQDRPWFAPDDPSNVRGDCPPGYSWTVRTADDVAVCGFVAAEPLGRWTYRIDPRWVWRPSVGAA